MVNVNFDGTFNKIHHMVLASRKSNNECYTFREVLKEDDAADFIKAMEVEVAAHEKRDHWEVSTDPLYLLAQRQFKPPGPSKGSVSQMEPSINSRLVCVRMVACNSGESTIGRLMLQ